MSTAAAWLRLFTLCIDLAARLRGASEDVSHQTRNTKCVVKSDHSRGMRGAWERN